jgi:membrane protease YdiL (CAAX protease family)
MLGVTPLAVGAAPGSQPLLGSLVGGFAIMALGLVLLTSRRQPPAPMPSAASTRRALLMIVLFTLFTMCFMRIIAPALLGREQSPWLLALGDVMFVTVGLFIWVAVLAEGRSWSDYGLRNTTPARLWLTTILGLGAAAVVSSRAYSEVFAATQIRVTADSLVFSILYAAVGSALPEELLFRGYLQGSLAGRVNRVVSLLVPALAFTAFRALRFFPGIDLPMSEWWFQVLGVALPLGLWWGLMRDLAGGSIWPCLVSHIALELGNALANASPWASL